MKSQEKKNKQEIAKQEEEEEVRKWWLSKDCTIAPLVPSAVGPGGTDAMAAGSSTSSSGEQQYSLRWNDFHSSILSSFRHLRDEEDFVDVTLACDSSSYTAHKVVLSACSPYFRRLLKVCVYTVSYLNIQLTSIQFYQLLSKLIVTLFASSSTKHFYTEKKNYIIVFTEKQNKNA